MEKELKEKWLEALRSGEYEQGRNTLEAQGKYCCLGVLCKISGDPTLERRLGSYDSLGYSDVDVLGTEDPLDTQNDLIRLNDGEGKTFPEIADWVEENL